MSLVWSRSEWQVFASSVFQRKNSRRRTRTIKKYPQHGFPRGGRSTRRNSSLSTTWRLVRWDGIAPPRQNPEDRTKGARREQNRQAGITKGGLEREHQVEQHFEDGDRACEKRQRHFFIRHARLEETVLRVLVLAQVHDVVVAAVVVGVKWLLPHDPRVSREWDQRGCWSYLLPRPG